jgi:hypothetical protein
MSEISSIFSTVDVLFHFSSIFRWIAFVDIFVSIFAFIRFDRGILFLMHKVAFFVVVAVAVLWLLLTGCVVLVVISNPMPGGGDMILFPYVASVVGLPALLTSFLILARRLCLLLARWIVTK